MALAVAVSAFGVLNAQLLSGPRLIQRMSAAGQFFSVFGRLSADHFSPSWAIVLLGGCGLGLLWLAGAGGQDAIRTIDWLTTGVVVVDGAFFVLTAGAVFVLGRGSPASSALRSWRLGYPVAPVLFIVGEIGLLTATQLNPATAQTAALGLAWIAAGALIWVILFRARG